MGPFVEGDFGEIFARVKNSRLREGEAQGLRMLVLWLQVSNPGSKRA